MTKKEYITKLLNALSNDREIAKPLLTLIEHNVLDEKVINTLVEIFKKAVKETTSEIKQAKLAKGLMLLKKIKKQEDDEEKIEKMLSNI